MLYAHSQWLHEHVADKLREYLHGVTIVATRIKLTGDKTVLQLCIWQDYDTGDASVWIQSPLRVKS